MTDVLNRQYHLVIDRSSSMETPDVPPTRWIYAEEASISFIKKCSELDPDGIDLYFFNSGTKVYKSITPERVANIYKEMQPMGSTMFTQMLTKVFENVGTLPSTILILTDGEPSTVEDKKNLAKLIVAKSKALANDSDLAISFIQIGKDPAAKQFLDSLDKDLVSAGAKFDIVDTKTCEDLEVMTLSELLLAAIED